MFNYLEKLRQKPEHTKTLIAFSGSLFVAGCILLVWLTIVFPNILEDNKIRDKVLSNEPSPLSSFFENINSGFSSIMGQFSEVKAKISDFSSSTQHYNNSGTNINNDLGSTTVDYPSSIKE